MYIYIYIYTYIYLCVCVCVCMCVCVHIHNYVYSLQFTLVDILYATGDYAFDKSASTLSRKSMPQDPSPCGNKLVTCSTRH